MTIIWTLIAAIVMLQEIAANPLTSKPVPLEVCASIVQRSMNDRPALRACRRLMKGLRLNESGDVLHGTTAELGQFPHLVALVYDSLDGDKENHHDFQCAGALIDSRFVLTTAQCVTSSLRPFLVRMGVVNFNDPNEMRNAVEIPIKQIHSHKKYWPTRIYNDIAILELERPVEFNEYIYPICLDVDVAEPEPQVSLWLTGWSGVNGKVMPDARKSAVYVTPLEKCRDIFQDYGISMLPASNKRIITSQLCAEDKDEVKDACRVFAGAPLHLIRDVSYKNYRLVGVSSVSYFGCTRSAPDVYTRVASFLDFIEEIVWPNGGD